MINLSWRTAIRRNAPSAPLQYLVGGFCIFKSQRILDFGCGQGDDIEYLKSHGYTAYGYDPFFEPVGFDMKFDIVLCTYVLNVLERMKHKRVLLDILDYLSPLGAAYVTVRRDIKNEGYRAHSGTYQCNVILNNFPIIEENKKFCIYTFGANSRVLIEQLYDC